MFVPHIAAAYLFCLLLSGTNGIGWIETNERNYVTVILTYIWKETPFVFLMMLGTYEQLNRGYVEMAKTPQFSPFDQFKHGELPFLMKPLLDSVNVSENISSKMDDPSCYRRVNRTKLE